MLLRTCLHFAVVTLALVQAWSVYAEDKIECDLKPIAGEVLVFYLSDEIAVIEGIEGYLRDYEKQFLTSFLIPADADHTETLQVYERVMKDINCQALESEQRRAVFLKYCEAYSVTANSMLNDGFSVLIFSEKEAVAYEEAGVDLPGFSKNPITGSYVVTSAIEAVAANGKLNLVSPSVITLVVKPDETIEQFFSVRSLRASQLYWKNSVLKSLAHAELQSCYPNNFPAGTRYFTVGLYQEISRYVLSQLAEVDQDHAKSIVASSEVKLTYPHDGVELGNWANRDFELGASDEMSKALSLDREKASFRIIHRFVQSVDIDGLRAVMTDLRAATLREVFVTAEMIEGAISTRTGYDIRKQVNLYTGSQSSEQATKRYMRSFEAAVLREMPDVQLYCITRIYEAALREQIRDTVKYSLNFAEKAVLFGYARPSVEASIVTMRFLVLFLPRDADTEDAWNEIATRSLASAMAYAVLEDMSQITYFASTYGLDRLDDRKEFALLKAYSALSDRDFEKMQKYMDLLRNDETLTASQLGLLRHLEHVAAGGD